MSPWFSYSFVCALRQFDIRDRSHRPTWILPSLESAAPAAIEKCRVSLKNLQCAWRHIDITEDEHLLIYVVELISFHFTLYLAYPRWMVSFSRILTYSINNWRSYLPRRMSRYKYIHGNCISRYALETPVNSARNFVTLPYCSKKSRCLNTLIVTTKLSSRSCILTLSLPIYHRYSSHRSRLSNRLNSLFQKSPS